MKTITQTKTFLNPEALLKEVGVEAGMIVADFGCGNGYYSVAAGSLVGKKGQIHSLDVLEEALSQTATLAKLVRLTNVATRLCDLETFGSSGLADGSCDLVIIASLLHQVEKTDEVVREAYRVLRTGGKTLVVEWKNDAPIGPEAKNRVPEKNAGVLLEKYGFRPISELPAGSFHYALLYEK